MKLKAIPLLVLLPALMLLVACTSGPSEADINATVEAKVEQAEASMVAPTAVPLPTYTSLPTYTPLPTQTPQVIIKEVVVTAIPMPTVTPAPASELDSAMKEELLALANNRDAWFLASDITTEALEGLYGSWSAICRNETSLADYKGAVYEVVRPWVLEILKMELQDGQEANRYYEVESWSSPWAYVEQTWKLGDKIVLGPELQLYLIESGAWRYHDC